MTLATGERVYLREVRPSDVTDTYYRWMNTPEITQYLESRFRPLSIEALREYVAGRAADSSSVFLAIALRDADRHIGNIKIGSIDWIHRVADVGLLIGEKDCWGKGYATEAIQLVTKYAFGVLNLRRLTAGAYEPNIGSIRAFERAGYSREGTRRHHYFYEGRYVDGVLLGIVRQDSENA